jgi:transcriptional regulator with XRE-family HTH domain
MVIILPQPIKRREKMFGQFVKDERLAKGIGLREFCRKLGIDASNWSKIERGTLAPPKDEKKLKKIANILGIHPTTDKWKTLKDQANIDAGIIPKDLLSDKEVLNSLPMFFRTIRSEKPTPEELDKLIKKIRKGG